ncbi:MAG: transposase [candidate division WOR-3 bacterium]
MRRARVKYEGSYHHVMNRGFKNEKIFFNPKAKQHFLELLEILSKKYGMDIYAYCLMKNHFHLVLKNHKNLLSEFMKELDGSYGIYYRKNFGGRGYVFASRFKSTLIQDDKYLKMSIIYTLLNPVKADIVENPFDYQWSSINHYFSNTESFIAKEKVEELFGNIKQLNQSLKAWERKNLPVKKSRVGEFLGSEEFFKEAMKKFDRRKTENTFTNIRTKKERNLEIEELIHEFEKEKNIDFKKANFSENFWKKLRAELLVFLHDKYLLTYRQISRIKYFKTLQLSSLGTIYKREKEKNVKKSSTVPE